MQVNGSKQEQRNHELVPNTGTEQSTHRISNDKLGLDPKNETVLNSVPDTPSMQPDEVTQGVQSHGLHKDSLNKDI